MEGVGYQKDEYFWGYEDFGDIFFAGEGCVITELDDFWGHFYAF